MSKAVLISINPKWCELIARGYKTIEVRKTRPKLETPFKCYIYCTNSGRPLVLGEVFRGDWLTEYTQTYGCSRKEAEKIWEVYNGKVMGEFVCDYILEDNTLGHDDSFYTNAVMTAADIASYCLKAPMYGWHISDLEIYDTPKELGEFRRGNFVCPRNDCEGSYECVLGRPPQSWCYVREIE